MASLGNVQFSAQTTGSDPVVPTDFNLECILADSEDVQSRMVVRHRGRIALDRRKSVAELLFTSESPTVLNEPRTIPCCHAE